MLSNAPPAYSDGHGAFLGGARDALGVPLLMILGSYIGFGSLARDAGLDAAVTVATTPMIWALPGQVALAELYAIGAPIAAIVLAVAMTNARFLPMSVTLLPLFAGRPRRALWRYVLIHLMSIISWAACMRRLPALPDAQRMPYFTGFAGTLIAAATAGTAVGYDLAGSLPPLLVLTLVFMNPLYFALLSIDVRTRLGAIALACGAVVGPLAHIASPDWGLMGAAALAGTAAFFIDRAWSRRRG